MPICGRNSKTNVARGSCYYVSCAAKDSRRRRPYPDIGVDESQSGNKAIGLDS